MKKIFALSLILISTLSTAQTYEIGTVCKESTQGWVRRAGACDNDGFLQGRGVASIGDLVVFGDFTKGLPNGVHYLTFQGDARQLEKGNVEYFLENKQRAISKLNGPFYDRPVDICKMNFQNGRPADNILNCGGVEAKAKSGNVSMNLANGRVIFSIGEADISGIHSRVNSSELDINSINHASMKLEGTALKVQLGGLSEYSDGSRRKNYNFYITSLNGKATITNDGEIKRKSVDYVKGIFDFSGVISSPDYRSRVILNKIPKTSAGTNVPASAASEILKYEFSIYGNKFKAALYSNTGSDLVASYLKVENGVEFDGSGFELCLNSPWVDHRDGQPNAAGAVQLSFKEGRGSDRNQYLNIVPRCGKITDQTGRSYSGFFDKDGKPSPK